MTSLLLRRTLATALVASLAPAAPAADSAGKSPAPTTASRSNSASASRIGKGPLPDPALLDGSTLPVDKKSDQGMIGDFELPGDENVRDGRVGGQQGGPAGAGQPPQKPPGVQIDLPMPAIPGIPGIPGGQGGLPGLGTQAGLGGLGSQSMGLPDPLGTGGGSNPLGGPGDPSAKADGIKVGQLGGEGSSQNALGGGDKPPAVVIGDSAMRIQTAGVGVGVVGAQQIGGNTQQHETGTGGKGTGGVTTGPNRAEKGRTMPAGL